MMQFSNSVK